MLRIHAGVRTHWVLPEAQAHAEAGRYEEALPVLRLLAQEGEDQEDVLFLLALSAIEVSRRTDIGEAERTALLDEAITALHILLVRNPELVRVRLELARAFFLKGEDDLSQGHFERVLAGNPPETVAANVNTFLSQIRARRRWSMHLGFAIAPDTNIGTSSAERTIYISTPFGRLPFQREAEELTTSGVGFAIWAGGEYQHPVGERLRLRLGADLGRREYKKSQFDKMSASVHAGPRWLLGPRTEASLLANVRRQWTANAPTSDSFGGRVEVRHRLTQRFAANAEVAWNERRNRTDTFLDGPATSLSLGGAWTVSPTLRVDVGAGFGQDRPESTRWHHDRRWLRGGLSVALPRGFSVSSSVRLGRAEYEGDWAFYTGTAEPRADRTRSLRVSVHNRAFTVGGFSPQLAIVRERRTSNAQLYGYKRTSGELSFVRQF